MKRVPPLLIYFVAHLIGVYFFTNGFFLTRYSITEHSACQDNPSNELQFETQQAPSHLPKPPGSTNGLTFDKSECWDPPIQFSRAVILIIDALRFDYVHWNHTLESLPNEKANVYNQNRLPIVHELLENKSKNCLLFKFRADPPTVTMQRIKGLTTGAMPTFIDISSNFDGEAIFEDNLIFQMVENKKKLVFMGDDTWENLFPGYFNISFPFPSFNVRDLHTVDNGVLEHLLPEIKKEKGSWDMIVAHFLGVDHVGHRYESNHPEMSPKLAQMNKVIKDVIGAIDNETLLLVIGDHGSTNDGNHGGATEEEMNAAMFAYSHKTINRQPFQSEFRSVSQVDLVPTLALLLGVPIPFGNIGGIIPEFFLQSSFLTQNTKSDEPPLLPAELSTTTLHFKQTLSAFNVNSWQIFKYLQTYSTLSAEFPQTTMNEITAHFLKTNEQFRRIEESENPSFEDMRIVANDYILFQNQVIKMCRDLWITFDIDSMVLGCAIMVLASVGVGLRLLLGPLRFSVFQVGIEFSLGIGLAVLAYFMGLAEGKMNNTINIVVAGGTLGILVALLRIQAWNWSDKLPTFRFSRQGVGLMFAGASLFALYEAGLFSNSIIENTQKVVEFLLLSAVIFFCFEWLTVRRASKSSPGAAPSFWQWVGIFVLCVKLSHYTTGGVYETVEEEFQEFFVNSLLPLFAIPAGVTLVARNHSLSISRSQTLLMWTQCCLVSLFWVSSKAGVLDTEWKIVTIPRAVYLLSLGNLALLLTRPSHSSKRLLASYAASLHCAAAFILCVFLSFVFPLTLVLGVKSALPLIVFLAQIYSFLRIVAMFYPDAVTSPTLPWPNVFLALFAIQLHFSTGHSWDFNGLHWAAGFVGFEEMNQVGCGSLMMLETFVGPILLTLTVPLFTTLLPLISPYTHRKQSASETTFRMQESLLFFAFCFMLSATNSSIFVFSQRRALHVWRVYAPKWVFDVCLWIIVGVLNCTLGHTLSYRIQKLHRGPKDEK